MKEYLEIIKGSALFMGISETEIVTALDCLDAEKKGFLKDSFIFTVEDKVESIGILLSGSAQIMQEDFWGNRTILSKLIPGDLFGEAFAFAGTKKILVGVIALSPCTVLFLDHERIVKNCPNTFLFHTRIIQNMIRVLALKNVMLMQKIEHVTKRTTRQKLLSFLSLRALLAGDNSFSIPFDRQELADYLSVDRSAMSSELAKMQREGILQYWKNHFILLKNEEM